jgi:hypothetical protein
MLRYLSVFIAAGGLAAAAGLPRVDLHVHIHDDQHPAQSLTPAATAAISKKLGVRFGVLAEGGCAGEIHDDRTLAEFVDSLSGFPLWRGLQVYGFDWPRCLSEATRARLDYIAADALVFPDRGGKNVRLWLPDVTFADAQDFMDRYVEFNARVLSQPIQVWANPTFLPESLKPQYDSLWTPGRMDRLIAATVNNGIAIEINAHYEIPSAAFIRRAKAAGAKFSFGSNRHVQGIGEIEYCLRMARECGLGERDIYVPRRPLP